MKTSNSRPEVTQPEASTPDAGSLARAMSLVLLIFSVLIVLATVYHANRLRIENLANHRTIAEGLARVSEREITQTLQAVDRLLERRADQWVDTADSGDAGFDALLARDLAGLPSVRTLAIVSASGRVEADSTGAATGRSLAGPALAEFEVAPGAAPVAISRVWRGRDLADGVPVQEGIDAARSAFFFTCSRRSQASADAPYAVATINPDFFATFLSGIVGRPEYVVELYRYDGTLLLSTRPQAARPGSSDPGHPVFSTLLQDKEIGVLEDNRKGDPQILAYRASRRYPLVIEVRVWHHEALASWRIEVRNLAIAAGLALVFVALVAILLHRYNLRRGKEQERARHANELAARVFEESFDAIFIADAERRIVRVNPAFTEITGYTESEAIGRTPRELSNCGDDDAAESEIWGAVRLQGEWRGDRVCRRNDGSLYWQRLAIGTVFDRSGAVSNYIGSFIDISESKEHEAALRDAKEAAEAANLAKSRFLATMSHELRTPMNAILGMGELQMMAGNTLAETQEYARTIVDAGNTLLALLNDILDLSKVEAGGMKLVDGTIDPKGILEQVGGLFAHDARGKGLTLTVRWQGPVDRQYRGDAIRLRQIVSNLVSNAIKFTDRGSIDISGGERTLAGGVPGLRFEVRDSGIGIARNHLAKLFEPFSQVDVSATRRFGGTGLGLSIVRRLAELMGGEAGVESMEGQGSLFWFTIRAVAIEGGRPGTAPTPAPALGMVHDCPVLVVEDDPVNRSLIGLMLQRIGCRVYTAENGEAALALLESLEVRPRMVFMDCHMPVMDGLQATRRIREFEAAEGKPRMPVIAVTAEVFEENRAACRKAGMDDFIEKPLKLETLHAVVAKHIGKAGLRPIFT